MLWLLGVISTALSAAFNDDVLAMMGWLSLAAAAVLLAAQIRPRWYA